MVWGRFVSHPASPAAAQLAAGGLAVADLQAAPSVREEVDGEANRVVSGSTSSTGRTCSRSIRDLDRVPAWAGELSSICGSWRLRTSTAGTFSCAAWAVPGPVHQRTYQKTLEVHAAILGWATDCPATEIRQKKVRRTFAQKCSRPCSAEIKWMCMPLSSWDFGESPALDRLWIRHVL